MTKLELIKLARKKGVSVEWWSPETGWVAILNTTKDDVVWLEKRKKLSTLIKFLTKNNIKINN